MVVGFTTTYGIGAHHQYKFEIESAHGEVYSIQHYVIIIKFVHGRSFSSTNKTDCFVLLIDRDKMSNL
jgi:hypothetical protein